MDSICLDRYGEQFPDCTFLGPGRIGMPYQPAEILHGILLLQYHGNDRPRAHELNKIVEEGLAAVNRIERFGILHREHGRPYRLYPEASLADHGKNRTHMILPVCTGLDHGKGDFSAHVFRVLPSNIKKLHAAPACRNNFYLCHSFIHNNKPLKNRNKEIIERIGTVVSRPTRILVITHLNPDGDAIGSALGLYLFLKKCGHDAGVMTPNDFPRFLKWLPAQEDIIQYDKDPAKASAFIKEAGIIFNVDFNDPHRLGKAEKSVMASGALKILIDHHPEPSGFNDIVLMDPEVSSTAELICNLIDRMNKADMLDKNIALCLFTGIMTDTGCFSYNSSRPETYQTVARLLSFGIDKDMAYYRVYNTFSVKRMRLLGYGLNNKLEVFDEYHTAIITLSKDEQEKYQFDIGDSEGFVNYPLSIKGINFSVLFLEKKGFTKLSFRSRGPFKVNILARRFFNGGGHDNAAGGEYAGALNDAVTKFKTILPGFMKDLDYEMA